MLDVFLASFRLSVLIPDQFQSLFSNRLWRLLFDGTSHTSEICVNVELGP